MSTSTRSSVNGALRQYMHRLLLLLLLMMMMRLGLSQSSPRLTDCSLCKTIAHSSDTSVISADRLKSIIWSHEASSVQISRRCLITFNLINAFQHRVWSACIRWPVRINFSSCTRYRFLPCGISRAQHFWQEWKSHGQQLITVFLSFLALASMDVFNLVHFMVYISCVDS